jgi:hypothetical protein
MIAFHGDKKIKAKYVARVRAHAKADEITKGVYWESGKGCAVGCTIHSGNHAAYETELGIPRILARLEDSIFESLPNARAMKWPMQFLSAVKPGADLSLVWPEFAVWLLTDKKYGVLQYAKSREQKAAIKNVAFLYGKILKGQQVNVVTWQRAAAAATDAYAYAAAAYATDAYAAYAAAYAAYAAATAGYAAATAAYAAAAAATADADATAAYAAAAATANADAAAYAAAAYAYAYAAATAANANAANADAAAATARRDAIEYYFSKLIQLMERTQAAVA